ncbi:MMPL family transporter [Botrimarina hoheduenensis]|uniref:Putative membrane protein YdgH n=1 Tax=Botrimarina hoheduenensis TaxID=2528000 RepID=A0A5C5WBZ9_9BACT|nr:MMPL family transporter [Botrimarina hoheduenensis]TWT48436.1 putative membrane protein YdgH [Botrimarina hoheduenensis]
MLVERLADTVNKGWRWVLLAWLLLAVGLKMVAPSWQAIALDGDLDYLPAKVDSLQGEALLKAAFPDEKSKSQAVVVLSRGGEPIVSEDRRFGLRVAEALRTAEGLPILDVWDERTQVVGDMMLARNGAAAMVVANTTTGLMDVENARVLERIESLLDELQVEAPEGLDVGLTGSAMIGGDLRLSIEESLASTEVATIVLVLLCLIIIYRAPLLVLIPLATIAVSMSVSYDLVALLADNFGPGDYPWSDFKIFTTSKIFVVVILFGAGTDYCLFLIARYREELAEGVDWSVAPGRALARVGDALAGSAFTTIVGLAMMIVAEYGKFSNSGPTIGVCILVALAACVTFAPALLRAMGPVVFWPVRPPAPEERGSGRDATEPSDARLWGAVADMVMRRPVTIMALSAWLAAPLIYLGAGVGVTHDFVADLAPERTSVRGAEQVRTFFGEGTIAPMKVIARLADGTKTKEGAPLDLSSNEGRYAIAPLHSLLFEQESVADVRSLYLPTGGDPKKRRFLGGGALHDLAVAGSPLTAETFVSHGGAYAGKVTQVSLLLSQDPFSSVAREQMPSLSEALHTFAEQATIEGEPNPWFGAEFHLVGVTPGMRDLEQVTNRDRWRIQIATVSAVFLVLLVILRRPLVCVYLIVTVLLSYWVTLGATSLFFQALYGEAFQGLDWKTPIFLFVILIAVGQDYNIYLATRVIEEQNRLGLKAGLRRAIVQTGGIITSCGVIMAGTFISMATGTLRGMVELGFALALGVLLDTFFVRTVVVPCFFALYARREADPAEKLTSYDASSTPAPRSAKLSAPTTSSVAS